MSSPQDVIEMDRMAVLVEDRVSTMRHITVRLKQIHEQALQTKEDARAAEELLAVVVWLKNRVDGTVESAGEISGTIGG